MGKKIIWFLGGGLLAVALIWFFFLKNDRGIVSPISSLNPFSKEKNTSDSIYSPYTFDALSVRQFKPGVIKLGKATRDEEKYTTYVFTYQSDGKTISGMANLPKGEGKFPVVILLRGWADREYYHIGLGTERSANNLAENGFVTLAPDFLGYGYSDWEDKDILLARFYRPVEVMSLITSINSLSVADSSRLGLWGHSNGGQIALSVLEITKKAYPTSLWAPVSLGFPECVLTYLGSQEEVGNPVKEKVDEFLLNNNPKDYSISEYFNQIESPFIIHQATKDSLIKTEWTNALVKNLESQGLSVEYFLYKGENHNFNYYKDTGEVLRQRDLEFFRKHLSRAY